MLVLVELCDGGQERIERVFGIVPEIFVYAHIFPPHAQRDLGYAGSYFCIAVSGLCLEFGLDAFKLAEKRLLKGINRDDLFGDFAQMISFRAQGKRVSQHCGLVE